jgi:hypothetical protein
MSSNTIQTKDAHACQLAQRAAEMENWAILAMDVAMFKRYHAITMRIIKYRSNLLKR